MNDRQSPDRSRLEFAGAVAFGSAVTFLASAASAFLILKSRKWGEEELAIALRWSALLSVGFLLILAAWRKVAFRMPSIPRTVVGIGLGVMIVGAWAPFAREQYGSAWPGFGAPLIPCWLAGAPAGFLVAARDRIRLDLPFAGLAAGLAMWIYVVASAYVPPV